MKTVKKSLISAAIMAVAVPSIAVLGATPALAEVWNCQATANQQGNVGSTQCHDGYGSYHVRVECNSGHWPYTRNIDGPVVYKEQFKSGPVSAVYGAPNGCHVVKAWTVAL